MRAPGFILRQASATIRQVLRRGRGRRSLIDMPEHQIAPTSQGVRRILLRAMSGTTAIEGVELDGFIKAQAHLEHAPNDVDGVVRALSLPDVDAWKRVEQG